MSVLVDFVRKKKWCTSRRETDQVVHIANLHLHEPIAAIENEALFLRTGVILGRSVSPGILNQVLVPALNLLHTIQMKKGRGSDLRFG